MILSICMATYNGAKYIRNQMNSILNQDLSDYPEAELEIIVSDDGSTDDTLQIIESYHDERIKIYHHQQKSTHKYKEGLFAATENFGYALEKATGDFIFLADQDDIWAPYKIKESLDVLTKHGGLCATAFYMGANTKEIWGVVKYKEYPRFKLRRERYFYGFSIGMTKEFLKKIIPMPVIPSHDIFMTMVASFSNCTTIIDEPCAFHRKHAGNTTRNSMYSPFLFRNYYRIKMLLYAIWRSFFV